VWDVQGNRYLDLTGSSGATLLGHGEPTTILAAVSTLSHGSVLFDGPSLDEAAVEETLARLYRASGAQFFRTGSCGTSAAVKLMRAASGRDVVATSGYHGWHDWATESVEFPKRGRVIEFGYDLEALESILDDGGVAGIIVTFIPHTLGPRYWQEIRSLATRAGALLAVDEIKTGIRYGLGGMAATTGVSPDVTILSKGLTNGMALSAVVDRSDVLTHAHTVNLGGTYRTERAPFAAARAMLRLLEADPSVFGHLADLTDRFLRGMSAVLRDNDFGAAVFGRAGDIELVCECAQLWEHLRVVGLQVGLHLPDDGNIMLTAAHQPEHVDQAIEALHAALSECQAIPSLELVPVDGGVGGQVSAEAFHRQYGALSRQIALWGTDGARAALR
jgi:glutamate-1-semialdehyde aminotransferase